MQNVNRVLDNILTDNITVTNNLVKTCATLIGIQLGLKRNNVQGSITAGSKENTTAWDG